MGVNLLIVFGGILFVFGLICMLKMDKVIVQNNGVFGMISATIFADAGIAGIMCAVIAILNMLGIVNVDLGMDNVVLLISALCCIGISLITFFIVSRKVEQKGKLIFPMIIVGMGTIFRISIKMTQWLFKAILKIEEIKARAEFAKVYYYRGDTYYLVSSSGELARLVDDRGNYVDVHKDANNNVVDDYGNVYSE